MTPTTTIKIAQTAPFYANEREYTHTIHVSVEGSRYFYRPLHVGDVVMSDQGYAEVIEVTDHECTALSGCGNTCGGDHLSDECCVKEIDLPECTETEA